MEKKVFGVPSGPYQFQESSRFPGGYVEPFILNSSNIFFELEDKRPHREVDILNEHCKFLLKASRSMETRKLCSICGEAPVKFFFFLNYSIISKNLTCCGSEYCRQQLVLGRVGGLRAFHLESLRSFKKVKIRRDAEALFRWALKLKKSSSPEEIFKALTSGYFKKNPLATELIEKPIKKPEGEKVEKNEKNPLPIRPRNCSSARRRITAEKQLEMFPGTKIRPRD